MRNATKLRSTLLAGALLASLAFSLPAGANTDTSPDWNPKVSEKLVKLPASILSKRIDKDFLQSSLGAALKSQESDIQFKVQTLADIKAALDLADDEQSLALQQKYLVEKQNFITLSNQKVAFQQQQLITKKRTLERVLKKLNQSKGEMTEDRKQLIEAQNAARERFENAVKLADNMIGTNPLAERSKYDQQITQFQKAINSLRTKVAAHEMNKAPVIDGAEVNKDEYIRHMVALTEGEIALLDMESQMLGYMAKLVSLDAQYLADQVYENGGDLEALDTNDVDYEPMTVGVVGDHF